MSGYNAQISFTNASTVQVTISDQFARNGEWTKKMSYIVNSGGDNTTGQLSGDSIDASFSLKLPGAVFKCKLYIDDKGNALATPSDEKRGQYNFKIHDQGWQGPVYKVNCKVENATD